MQKRITELTQAEASRARRLIRQGRLKFSKDKENYCVIDYEAFRAIGNLKTGRPAKERNYDNNKRN